MKHIGKVVAELKPVAGPVGVAAVISAWVGIVALWASQIAPVITVLSGLAIFIYTLLQIYLAVRDKIIKKEKEEEDEGSHKPAKRKPSGWRVRRGGRPTASR